MHTAMNFYLKVNLLFNANGRKKPVGEPVLRDLYGTVMSERAAKGILITTSRFTARAKKFAEDKPLELIDGTLLLQLLKDCQDYADTSTEGYMFMKNPHSLTQLSEITEPSREFLEMYQKGLQCLPISREVTPIQFHKMITEFIDYVQYNLNPLILKVTETLFDMIFNQDNPDISLAKQLLKQLDKILHKLQTCLLSLKEIKPPPEAGILHNTVCKIFEDHIRWLVSMGDVPGRGVKVVAT